MSRGWVENRASRGWRIDVRELWAYRELAGFFALRDISVRYKQAVFGVGWAVAQPLAAVAVFTLVFRNLAGMPSDGVPYPIFAFTGMVIWSYIASSVTRSTQSLVNHAPLVTKIYFPRLLAPAAAVLPGMVDLACSLLVLLVALVLFGMVPAVTAWTLPLWIGCAAVVALAVGVWLAALNIRYRDVNQAIGLLVQLWLFVTPVAYPLSVVDARWQTLYALNPAVGVVEGFRWALLGTPWPGEAVLISVGSAAVLLTLGVVYFQSSERQFADII